MRTNLKLLGLAMALNITLSGAGQTAHRVPPENLELRLQPEAVRINIPQAFTVLIVNRSDHDMRLPMPDHECRDVALGTILLGFNFVPAKPGPTPLGHGCFKDYAYQPILDRVRSWKVLRPGESLSLETISVKAGEAGTYDYWAHYYPPGMPKADEEVLQKAGIDFPKAELESTHVKFVRKR